MLVDAGIFLTTFFMVLVMEMGDKTQFLVMALASRYKPGQVFLGIVIGVFFLNLLAVLLGTVIGGIKVLHDGIQAGAALLFIFFGLLSLWPEKQKKISRGRPVQPRLWPLPWLFSLLSWEIKPSYPPFPLQRFIMKSPSVSF